MISIEVRNSFVNDIQKAIAKEIDNIIAQLCADGFKCIHWSGYRRKTPEIPAGQVTTGKMLNDLKKIHRIMIKTKDGTKHTHALIPCIIIPYGRVFVFVQEQVLREICWNEATIAALAKILQMDPKTILRWWKYFKMKSNDIMAWLVEQFKKLNQCADVADSSNPKRFENDRAKGRKIFEWLTRYRGLLYPGFPHNDLALLNLRTPLLIMRKLKKSQVQFY